MPCFRKTCSQCGILHHFGRVCMKKTSNPGHLNSKQAEISKARYVCNSWEEDECHEAFHLNPNQVKADIRVTIKGTPVQVCIDSGATANTIDYMQQMRRSVSLKTNQCETSPLWRRQPCPDSSRRIVFRNDQYILRQGKWTWPGPWYSKHEMLAVSWVVKPQPG